MAGVLVPGRQIKEFSASIVSSALTYGPSARRIIAVNQIYAF
jgi:hypothetical protein